MADTDLILAAKTTAEDPVRVDGEVGPLTTNLDGRLRVATKPGYFPPVSGELTTSGNTLAVNVTDASNVMLHIRNTGSAAMAAGVFVFEGSVDSTDGSDGTWFALQAIRSDSNTIETGRAASSLAAGTGQLYAWELSVNAVRWFRIRCTTTVTASSIARWTIIRGTYATEPIPGIQTHAVTGTVTANSPSGSAISVVTAASTNASNQKSSAGNLFEISAANPTATPAFLKLYNKASAPTVGTDVPILTIPIPANNQISIEFGNIGKRFTTGIAMAVTGAIVATDTTSAVAGIQISGTYA